MSPVSLMPEAVKSPSSVNMGNILKPLLCASAGKEVTDSAAPLCANSVLVISPLSWHTTGWPWWSETTFCWLHFWSFQLSTILPNCFAISAHFAPAQAESDSQRNNQVKVNQTYSLTTMYQPVHISGMATCVRTNQWLGARASSLLSSRFLSQEGRGWGGGGRSTIMPNWVISVVISQGEHNRSNNNLSGKCSTVVFNQPTM